MSAPPGRSPKVQDGQKRRCRELSARATATHTKSGQDNVPAPQLEGQVPRSVQANKNPKASGGPRLRLTKVVQRTLESGRMTAEGLVCVCVCFSPRAFSPARSAQASNDMSAIGSIFLETYGHRAKVVRM